jgi:hypothetical protein
LDYVSPVLIPLSLFSNKVKNVDKRKIQSAILKFGKGDWNNRTVRLKKSSPLQKKNLWDLVDSSSICAVRALKIDSEFILKTDSDVANLTDLQKFAKYCDVFKSRERFG